MHKLTTQIILFEGFDELDAIGPFEALNMAKADVRLVTLQPTENIIGAHGLSIRPQGQLNIAQKPDLLIVPGGGWITHAKQSVRTEIQRGEIPKVLSYLHQQGTIVASVCTGAMLLAAAGLLTGRPATTNRSASDDLIKAGANIINARVVDDDDIITAGGVTAGLDLALWLIERFIDASTARQVECALEYERQGIVWHAK